MAVRLPNVFAGRAFPTGISLALTSVKRLTKLQGRIEGGTIKKTMDFSAHGNYTECATAAGRRIL
jgi:hypothetical protein